MVGAVRSGTKDAVFFVVYLLLQALAVVGIPPGRWPDTTSYEQLSLTGANVRLPTVPLLYKIFPTDPLRVWAQVLLAAVAWWVLASVAGRMIADRRVRVGLQLVLLNLGLVSAVVNWNTVLLSESATISLTALLVAACLHYAQRPSGASVGLVLATLLFWTLTKQAEVYMAVLIALAAIVDVVRRHGGRRLPAVLAAGAVVVAVIGLAETRHNQTLTKNAVGAIIQGRILTNPEYTRWFVGQGMPYDREIAGYAGQYFLDSAKRDASYRAFTDWVNTDGISTYEKFMLAHLEYTLLKPLPYFPGEQASDRYRSTSVFASLEPNPRPAMLAPIVDYGRHRTLVPTVIDRLLFDQGAAGDVVALALLAGVLIAWTWRRYGFDRRLVVPGLVTLAVVPQGYIVWLSGGEALGELDRLSMVTAVLTRIGLWLLVAIAADRALAGGDPASSDR